MKLLRNPEVFRDITVYVVFSVLATVFTVVYAGRVAGGIVLVVCLLFLGYYIWTVNRRYRRITELTCNLDAVLHGETEELLQDCKEGELAILHSHLNKLLLRMREQSHMLTEDKMFLADTLADISHQMKTPLTTIRLILNELGREDLSETERQDMVRNLDRLVERLHWLVYALLRMSKLDAGTAILKKNPVSVRELLRLSYEALAVQMDLHGITWRCEVEGNIFFMGDLEWSMEAVSNVLKNCMEHTPEGGSITVHAEENAVYTQILICDTGTGIAPEDLPHLFERFYRGKAQDSNSVGIGLSLAQKIIQIQNGVIRAGNGRKGGAEFLIRFYRGVI